MICYTKYASPLGEIALLSERNCLTALHFAGGRYYSADTIKQAAPGQLEVFDITARWLDIFFAGRQPDFLPPLQLQGTPFQMEVWRLLQQIPYGSTVTYKYLARQLAAQRGGKPVAPQAVGGAVGRNPVSIIIPCHRVVGVSGSLTGYAGGMERKIALLRLEGADTENLSVPKQGSAL